MKLKKWWNCVGHLFILFEYIDFTCPLIMKYHCKSVQISLTDHLYPMMKHFCPDGRGPIQDGSAPIHRAQDSLNILMSMKMM